jgi:hypothetical protein
VISRYDPEDPSEMEILDKALDALYEFVNEMDQETEPDEFGLDAFHF